VSPLVANIVEFVASILGAFLLPWVAMRALVPVLEESGAGAVVNYRGRRVVYGLGLVWAVWVAGMLLADLLTTAASDLSAVGGGTAIHISILPAGFMPFVLVLGAMVFGFADDVYGTSSDKGFRGHLSALSHGRLTTGGLKLFGVGALAATALRPDLSGSVAPAQAIAVWLLQVLGIALTANFVNLLDLRPGRALKGYSVLVVVACASIALSTQFAALVLIVVVMGPVLAVWRLDLGERGMLGDAGANAAGALAGYVAVSSLPVWWGLTAYVAIMLAANLASEKYSFSRLIEGNRALNWLDGLGRTAADTPTSQISDDSSKTSREV